MLSMRGRASRSMSWVVGIAAMLAVVSCEEELAPEGAMGRIVLRPAFPSAAAADFPFASIAVTLRRLGEEAPAVDTVVAVAADADTVDLAFQVLLVGGATLYDLTLALRDSAGVTFFAARDTVVASASPTAGGNAVLLTYVGIGANAVDVEILTRSVFVAPGDTLLLDADALDSAGAPIAGTPVIWSTSDTAAGRFPNTLAGRLVGGNTPGTFSVIAELFTGQADTVPAVTVAGGGTLVADAIDSLENALFLAIQAVDDSLGSRDQAVDWGAADMFSFEPARTRFAQAFQLDPGNDTAAFGVALTTILTLKDNPNVRMRAQEWDDWQALFPFDAADSLFQGSGPYPPSLAVMQAVVRDDVLPALLTALGALDSMDDPGFVFVFTDRMQGRSAPSGDPDEVPREFDYTDVLLARAALNAIIAIADGAVAYQLTPDPYGPAGVDAAMAGGSTFLTLAAGGATYLADAQMRLASGIGAFQAALNSLETETDPQANDIVIYNPQDTCCPAALAQFTAMSVSDARRILGDAAASIQGPNVWTEDFGRDTVMVTIDASAPLLNPVTDLKALLPNYQTMGGQFTWIALAFDEWVFPNPTFGGLFPGLLTSDSLKRVIDLEGTWEDASQPIDEWYGMAAHADGRLFALTFRGQVRDVAPDFSSEVAAPALPFDSLTFTFFGPVIANTSTDELWAIDGNSGDIYTQPADGMTPWAFQLNIGCCGYALTESPTGGTVYAHDGFNLWEIPSDLSTALFRPQNFAFANAGFTSNVQTNELVSLSVDGLVYTWLTTDTLSPWVQVFTLPNVMQSSFYDEWVGITRGPSGTNLWAVTERGVFVELDAGYTTFFSRPDVPASNVWAITANPQTGELAAMTSDGRIFTRPPDAATPWTLRITLPRFIL